MGVGKSGEYVDKNKLSIKFGELQLLRREKFLTNTMSKNLESI